MVDHSRRIERLHNCRKLKMIDREFVKERIDKIFDMIDNLDDDNRYEVMQELSTFKVELLQKIEKPVKTIRCGGGLLL